MHVTHSNTIMNVTHSVTYYRTSRTKRLVNLYSEMPAPASYHLFLALSFEAYPHSARQLTSHDLDYIELS